MPYKHLDLEKPHLEIQVQEDTNAFVLKLKSDVFTPFVELDFADADVIFSDNYFFLTGEEYEVKMQKSEIRKGFFADAEDVQSRLKVRTLADTYER